MKRHLLILIGCICSLVSFAENQVATCRPDSNQMRAYLFFNRADYIAVVDSARSSRATSNTPPDCSYAYLLTEAGIYAYELEYSVDAVSYLTEAHELWRTVAPAEDSIRQLVTLCLGSLHLRCGEYSKAESYLKQTIAYASNHSAAIGHLLLGEMYLDLGDYKQSETHIQRAIQWGEEQQDSVIYMQALANAGYVTYQQCHDSVFNHYLDEYIHPTPSFSRTEQYEHIYNTILKKHDNSDIYIYAPILAYYDANNMLSEAIVKIENYLSMMSNGFSVDYYSDLKRCNLLGRHYYQSGLYVQAMILLLRGQRKAQAILDGSPDFLNTTEYSGILRSLIFLYHAMEIPHKAEPLLKESAAIHKRNYINSVSFLSERQRAQFWEVLQQDFVDLYPWFEYRYYNRWPELTELAYDNELFTKGLLLASTDAVSRSIADSNDSTLIRQWEELTQLRRYIIAMRERSPQSQALQEYEQQADSLEKIITIHSAAYRDNMRQWAVTWDSVRAALKPDQVAIEFMRAPLNADSTMYCALLLRHDSPRPELIPLFEQQQVARLLHTSRGDSVAINTTYLFEKHGQALTQLIWGPIKPYIREGEQIFIAPTHVLHQIAIEHLPYDATRTMNEVYQITRLSSTRELVLPAKPVPHQRASLYGGILYADLTADEMLQNQVLYAQQIRIAEEPKLTQRKLTNMYDFPLYATWGEVDTIAAVLREHKVDVTVYTDFSACEESVKALSGKKQNILHFATHGMYVDTLTTNEPLDRCVLSFAGANRALRGDTVPEGIEDGVLTAKEISVLDFRDADIVVLSACETALGDVSGEGVFGLQRAFKMAGAQTILMALWQVDDKATQMLMTAFYRYYSQGLPKREAFRRAQQEVRHYTHPWFHFIEVETDPQQTMINQGQPTEQHYDMEITTIEPYTAPYFWAGFILFD